MASTAHDKFNDAHRSVRNGFSPSAIQALRDILAQPSPDLRIMNSALDHSDQPTTPDALLFILPLLIVLSTFLFVLLLFLVCVIFIRRRRGIVLRDSDGPTDMSREEYFDADGGFEGIESRWLESVSEPVRSSYLRARGATIPPPTHFSPTDPLAIFFTFRPSAAVSTQLRTN
jgi:hypothetical protein